MFNISFLCFQNFLQLKLLNGDLPFSFVPLGSSVPSAFLLWVMRELPAMSVTNTPEEAMTVTFIRDDSPTMHHPQRWTAVTSSQNPVHTISFSCSYNFQLNDNEAFSFNNLR